MGSQQGNLGNHAAAGRSPNGATANEPNLYEVLGIGYGADAVEIRRAYRAAMKEAHPDHHARGGRAAAEERAKLLNRAYSTLSRPESRRAYDATIRGELVQDQLMSRYAGGFGTPGHADAFGERLRRAPTEAERREQQLNDRSAMLSIVIVFGGVTLAVVVLLLLWAVARGALSGLG